MLILSVLFNLSESYSGSTLMLNLWGWRILSISAIIMGFTVSSAVFLLGQLFSIKRDFFKTITQIKHNIYFTIGLFVGIIALLSLKQTFLLNVGVMTFFFLQLYALFEIASAIFIISFQVNKDIMNHDKENHA